MELKFAPSILNLDNSHSARPPLFLGEQMGLLDTIHKPYAEIERYAFRLKAMDWSETEFPLISCRNDFKYADPVKIESMLYNTAAQWEADSGAALNVVPILAPVISSTELWTYYGEELRNENLHARVYSNIPREGMEDPEEGLREILKRKSAVERLFPVFDVFAQTQLDTVAFHLKRIRGEETAHLNASVYTSVMKFIIAKYVMERLQFTSSFAITFLTGQDGEFNPIINYVEKICQDEFEIHAKVGELILATEFATMRGENTYRGLKSWALEFVRSVVRAELLWNEFMTQDGRQIPHASKSQVDKMVFWNAATVYATLGLKPDFEVPKRFPLPKIEKSFNISLKQSSPMEEKGGMYMLGELVKDVEKGPMSSAFAL